MLPDLHHRRNAAIAHDLNWRPAIEPRPPVRGFRPAIGQRTVKQEPEPFEETYQKARPRDLVLIEHTFVGAGLHSAPRCTRDIKECRRLCVRQAPSVGSADDSLDNYRNLVSLGNGLHGAVFGSELNGLQYQNSPYDVIYIII